MATVCPRPEDIEAHARILLEEAGVDVHLVQTTMDGPTGLMFIVPDDLADRYLARIGHGDAVADVPADEVVETPEIAVAPRRGRKPGSKNKPKIIDGAD